MQLIGTAHGQTLDNLLLNPTLSDLVGGIEAVTLSDEEARRRGTQKTVLERRAPPTFDVLVEIQNRDRFAVHADILNSVDALLRGFPLAPEIRMRDAEGGIQIEKAAPATASRLDAKETKTPRRGRQPAARHGRKVPEPLLRQHFEPLRGARQSVKIYPYGVARNRLMQAAKRLGVPAADRQGAERGRRAGDTADLLSRPSAGDCGRRASRPADLCAARQHGRADGAVPG